jgi:hypothetical protein
LDRLNTGPASLRVIDQRKVALITAIPAKRCLRSTSTFDPFSLRKGDRL